jgi:hypothetical protein
MRDKQHRIYCRGYGRSWTVLELLKVGLREGQCCNKKTNNQTKTVALLFFLSRWIVHSLGDRISGIRKLQSAINQIQSIIQIDHVNDRIITIDQDQPFPIDRRNRSRHRSGNTMESCCVGDIINLTSQLRQSDDAFAMACAISDLVSDPCAQWPLISMISQRPLRSQRPVHHSFLCGIFL